MKRAKLKQAPLRTPNVGRIDEIQQQIVAAEQRAAELWEAYLATDAPLYVANERLDACLAGAGPDPAEEARLRAELATVDLVWKEASEAWRAASDAASALRHDWLQLGRLRHERGLQRFVEGGVPR
jgi:hypothetical protein